MNKNIAFILSFISMLVLLFGCGSNYSKTVHPYDMKFYTFEKGSGYQETITIRNKDDVNSIWNIIQHMKEDKTYQMPANSTSPRLCFGIASSANSKDKCFELNEKGDHLLLTELEGDTTGKYFKLSKTNSDKIKKLYQ